MTTAQQVLAVARAELGTVENPYGSNHVKYNDWYYDRPVSGPDFPWCAVFQSWVADRAGATSIIPKHAYTPAGAGWFQSRGQWSRVPRVGSLVYYDLAGMGRISHVGIIEAVNSDGTFTAIEGNTDGGGSRTGGKVMRQRRSNVGARGGFGHPAYNTTATFVPGPAATPAPAPAPAAEQQSTPGIPEYQGHVLRRGEKSDAVRTMQERLNAHLAPTGTQIDADGDFGPNTEKWVKWFQQARGLDQDGRVGPNTWRSLWS